MRDVQIVIEAASEKIDIKKKIFRDLAGSVNPKAILATNTSALPIGELAAETDSPGRVVGMHFFNPVSRMKLIEIVIGKQTSDEIKTRTLAFARQIGKLPVVVRDSPGFLINRVLFPYLLDAAELFQNGVSADEIDHALLNWGMPMGPLRLIDEIGVDITVDIADTLAKAYGKRDQSPEILRKMLSAKMLGRKSGSGFYNKYESKQPTPNGSLQQWRRAGPDAAADPAAASALAEEALPNRLVFLMVNEAARCLEEKVVESPEDADYGMILGTGFAPFRGGPLRFADSFELKKLVAEMERLAQKDEKFVPCEILKKHARAGTTFYES
jgi:3-hydroxyacyl-CoA dehydrogenase/enoyl-CoA hydratase/3-hydroxybutyryl-CoA epimerase